MECHSHLLNSVPLPPLVCLFHSFFLPPLNALCLSSLRLSLPPHSHYLPFASLLVFKLYYYCSRHYISWSTDHCSHLIKELAALYQIFRQKEKTGKMASSNSYNSPCAACKFLRRKCMPSCIFAPYFPPEEPQKFANVHKIFGASNVTKLLNELLPHQREDAVNSLAYEAEARVRDPVYGCVGAISYLQRQVERLQKELDAANTDLIRFAWSDALPPLPQGVSLLSPRQRPIDVIISTTRHNIGNFHEGSNNIGVSNGNVTTSFHQTPCATLSFPSAIAYNPNPWSSISFDNSNSAGDVNNIDGGGVAGGEPVL